MLEIKDVTMDVQKEERTYGNNVVEATTKLPKGHVRVQDSVMEIVKLAFKEERPNIIVVLDEDFARIMLYQLMANQIEADRILMVTQETEDDEIYKHVFSNLDSSHFYISTYGALKSLSEIMKTYRCNIIIDRTKEWMFNFTEHPELLYYLYNIIESYPESVTMISENILLEECFPEWMQSLNQR